MVVLVICMNEVIKSKHRHLSVTRLYINFQTPKGSYLCSQWWKHAEIQIHSNFYDICKKNGEDPSKNEGARVADDISPIISLWEFLQTLKGS